jgi:hypothetical protein
LIKASPPHDAECRQQYPNRNNYCAGSMAPVFKKIHVVSDPVFDQHLKGIRNLVGDVLLKMGNTGEPVPEPIAIKHFSGKFMVRAPPDIHRKLAIQAAESAISLNRIASSKLSQ